MEKIYSHVSVIIPVFNDVKKLRKCLAALEQQTYPHDAFEIIVIDNNSTQDIKSVILDYKQAKYVFEAKPGSYAARNHGLSIAKGKILGFTDADCVPASDWIEKGVQRLLETNNCGFIAGRIDFFFENPKRPTIAELYDSRTFLNQKKYVEEEQFGATANLFTFRNIFDKVGLFNTQLKSGGDREWGKRTHAAGYTPIYADDVRIAHPARYSIQALKKKVSRVVEGQHTSDQEAKKSYFGYIREYLKDAKPSLRGILEIMIDQDLKNLGYKLGFVYVHITLRNVRAWKRLRLNFK